MFYNTCCIRENLRIVTLTPIWFVVMFIGNYLLLKNNYSCSFRIKFLYLSLRTQVTSLITLFRAQKEATKVLCALLLPIPRRYSARPG